ncbi:hypothetical protein ECFRIK523_0299, partial [Escherichia coli FRIK523]
LNRTIVEYS